MKSQILELRKAILSNLSSTKQSLIIKRNQVLANSSKVQGAIQQVPSQERIFLDLSRQQQIKQELYIYLLQKREETAISKTSNISNSLTIDYPKAEIKAVSPKKVLVFALAAFLGLLIPLIRIILADTINKKILTKSDITNLTNVPIVGEISHNETKDNLVIVRDSRSSIAEQFRALRTNIQFYLNDDDEKVILVTSSMPGEGKSFLSINFANVIALSGKKVVIMELDLRKPKVSVQFNLSNKIGFSNYIITKDLKAADIVNPSGSNPNLFVISSGPVPPNPAELLLHERTDLLIKELKAMFDFIVIDSPPIGLVTDAQLMSKFSNLTLYVVRQKYTLKEQLFIPESLYQEKKMKKIGIVVNDIEVTNKAGYGYGYGFGYGYGYGYYSNDEVKKKTLKDKIKEKIVKR